MTTPNQSTPTPRTDESTSICGSISQREHVHADFARTLERELTEANAKYAKLVADYSHAVLGESEQQELERVKAELTEALQQLAAKDKEMSAFTNHVGASSFKEAVEVLLRTKQQDEDKLYAALAKLKNLKGEA